MPAPETDQELKGWLEEAIFEANCGTDDDGLRIRSFQEAGLLTGNEGLVLSFRGGPEFQLTILRSG